MGKKKSMMNPITNHMKATGTHMANVAGGLNVETTGGTITLVDILITVGGLAFVADTVDIGNSSVSVGVFVT